MKQKKGNKERVVAWLYPEMIANMNDLMEIHNMKNHTEFVEKAVDFYIGYLGTQNSTNYLSKMLVESISGTLRETENRQSANLFRLSVEMSMMMNILAAGLEISDEDLRQLRGRCVSEVKRNKGRINMDEVVKNNQGLID